MDHLGVGYLSVFGLPPVEFVHLTAGLGCSRMSIFLRGLALEQLGYPTFSLKHDAALRDAVRTALREREVTITLADGFLIAPGADMHSLRADLDVVADLGAPLINIVSIDPDRAHTFDQLGVLTELAAARGLQAVVEPVPAMPIGDLPTALAAIQHVGRPDLRLLVDTMHLVRSGSGAAELAAIDPVRIGYAQINDTTLRPRMGDYLQEAMFERLAPGEGELPLLDILCALPPDIVIEVEVPQRSLALAGVGPFDRLRPCVDAARRLLELAQGQAGSRTGNPAAR